MKEAVKNLGYEYEKREKTYVPSCNLCGGTELTLISHKDRYGYKAPATSCNRCTLTVLNPVMTNQEYSNFYAKVYRPLISAFHGRLYDAETIQGMQREYAEDRIEFLRPYLKGWKNKTMLDIGGSTGVVAHAMQTAFGFKATVIDPAPLEIEKAKKFGLETITGFVEDYDSKGKNFDFIGIFQTVDHLLDVSSTISKVHQMLSDDGYLFIDIVDFRAAYLRNHSVEAAIKIDHPYYLTDQTMKLYLDKCGFQILGMEYSSDHLHIGYICRKGSPNNNLKPSSEVANSFFQEIRWVQNTGWLKNIR